jgi:hypothetical protein
MRAERYGAGTIPLPSGLAGGVCVVQRAECYLVLGRGHGGAAFQTGGHGWATQLDRVTGSYR